MAMQRHLSRAPIREAVIDIQFQSATTSEEVAEFAEAFAVGRGQLSDLWAANIELKAGADGIHQTHTGIHVGKRLNFEDGKHIAQFRTNGFTFSRLPPYETWEVMNASASEVWKSYLEAVRPQLISRLAVRFINSLRLPLPVANFDEYLVSAPQVPTGLPQSVAGFLSRVQIVDPENSDIAVVTQMLEGEEPGGAAINVLLDIDVFHSCDLRKIDVDTINSVLDRLRNFKNKTFFGYLQEKTLEQYV